MTREEYLKLVKNSDAFKVMDHELQQTILKAKGEQMEKFMEIFVDEVTLITKAKQELVDSNDAVLRTMVGDMRKFTRDYLKTSEDFERKNEAQNMENLLQSM